ncbi:hypothetical protein UM715_14775 [Staphylococcus aureus]|nr:hypothetical protein UM715_14775 [Staphylococcus aureus]
MRLTRHNRVDDYPYGGGQGIVLKPEPVFNAMEDFRCHRTNTRYFNVSTRRAVFTSESC